MINIPDENLIPFAEVVRRLPQSGRGKPIHIATIHRWRSCGVRSVKLSAVRIGGTWFTTWSAVRNFIEGVSNLPTGEVDRELDDNVAAIACEKAGF